MDVGQRMLAFLAGLNGNRGPRLLAPHETLLAADGKKRGRGRGRWHNFKTNTVVVDSRKRSYIVQATGALVRECFAETGRIRKSKKTRLRERRLVVARAA